MSHHVHHAFDRAVHQISHLDRRSFAIGSAVAITSAVAYYATKKYTEGPPSGIAKYTIKREENSHGGLILSEALKNHGVKVIFTLSGGHISPILVGCKELGIRVIDTRHEVNAAFAADAISRLTGVPGVAVVTAGPGVTNTITAIKNAQIAQSPLILIGGATSDLVKGMGSLQDIDQISLIKPHVKWYAHIATVKDIVPTVEKAFWMAQSGTPGPVFLELPLDVLYQEKTARDVFLSKKTAPASIMDKIANWYMTYHVDKIFAGASEVTFHKPLEPRVTSPSERQVRNALEMVKKAKKPFLMVGSQVLLKTSDAISGNITFAINKLNMPTGLSGMARGVLGRQNPLQIRQKMSRRTAFKEADLVIIVGLPLDFRVDYGRNINGRAKLIKVNRDHNELYLNNMIRPATLAIEAEPASFLIQLSALMSSEISQNWSQWLTQLQSIESSNENSITETPTKEFLHPIKVCKEIESVADDNAIFVGDGGDFVGTAAYILKPRLPLSWLDPGAFGTLGVGSAFAMAAKVSRPDQEVWIIFGDGAVGFSISEFDTMVRHKIPVIAVVGNDGAWMQILREQVKILKDDVGCSLVQSNYHDVVKGFGAEGILIKEEKELREGLLEAKRIVKEKQVPVLVNVLISKSDFREGSISV